jgi:hypothetical protein
MMPSGAETSVDLGIASDADAQSELVYFGETCKSLRQLLHRTCYNYSTHTLAQIGGVRLYHFIGPSMYPVTNGTIVTGSNLHFSSSAIKYNYTNKTYIDYISPLFLGRRGSTVWHFNVSNSLSATTTFLFPALEVYRTPDTAAAAVGYTPAVQITNASFNNVERLTASTHSHSAAGQTLTNQHTQTGVQALIPFCSQLRFHPTKGNPVGPHTGDTLDLLAFSRLNESIAFTISGPSAANDFIFVDAYVHAGPDFNLFMFVDVPTQTTLGSIPI